MKGAKGTIAIAVLMFSCGDDVSKSNSTTNNMNNGSNNDVALCDYVTTKRVECDDELRDFNIVFESTVDSCEENRSGIWSDCGLSDDVIRDCFDSIDRCERDESSECAAVQLTNEENIDCLVPECKSFIECVVSNN